MLITDTATSTRMSRTRGRNNSLECRLRSALFARGWRYRIHVRVGASRRTIDIAFGQKKVAVFFDGCFWHGCPAHGTWPKRNAAFWRRKINANRMRDRDTDRQLADLGWSVVRIWEHEPLSRSIELIETALTPTNVRSGRKKPQLETRI